MANVIKAAEYSQSEAALVWVLVGDGEERLALENEITHRGLRNIRMLPFQPAEGLARMYATADVLLLNQAAAVEDAVIPSKLLTYMAAGRAIVAAVSERSEAAKLVCGAACGVIVRAESPEALADAVLMLRGAPGVRRALAAKGRAYVEKHFTKSSVLAAYDEFFLSILCGPEMLPVDSENGADNHSTTPNSPPFAPQHAPARVRSLANIRK